MNIKSLQLFIHLCDSKNFSKTAAAMHVSPSALSRQIQKLEDETGQELLIRDNRSVDLTPAGKQLLPVALNIVSGSNIHLFKSIFEYSQVVEVASQETIVATIQFFEQWECG